MMEPEELKEKYYYLRRVVKSEDKEGVINVSEHRCGIVYLISSKCVLGKRVIARGISLCNDEADPFLRDAGFLKEKDPCGRMVNVPFEGGLKKAKKRAFKAFNSKETTEPIQTTKAAAKVDRAIKFKSAFMPKLSSFEAKILDGGYKAA